MVSAACLLGLACLPALLGAEASFSPPGQTASLAVNQLLSGNLKSSEISARRALKRYDELLGPLHPHTAMARRNLAVALWHLGRMGEAEAELLQARSALIAAEGEAGPGALRCSVDLAEIYAAMMRGAEAAALYERAWHAAPAGNLKREAASGAARHLGRGHEAILQSALADARLSASAEAALALEQLEGEIELGLRRPALALKAFGRAHAMGQKLHGKSHPFLAPSLEGMARSLKALGQGAEAEPLFNLALEGRKRMAGILNYASLPEHEALGRLMMEMGRKKEAREEFKNIVALRKEIQPGHPAIRLGESLLERLKR